MTEAELTPPPPPEEKGNEPPAASQDAREVPPAKPRVASSLKVTGLVLVVGVVAFAIWYFAVRTPEPRDDFGRFQGEWQLAVPADGAEKQPAARLIPGVTIRVTGDRWVYRAGDKDGKKYTLTLRPDADPKEIDLTQLGPDERPTAFLLRGIYTIDRDRAKVIVAPGGEPRPTSLDADGWLLERLK